MTTRGEHYRKFGPLRSEAAELVLLEYINILRAEQGMPALTQEGFMDLIENHMSSLDLYDWMAEGSPEG